MLSLFIDDKLSDDEKFFVETHLLKCGDCYKKYIEMKTVMNNLHFEYEKLMDEFKKIDENNSFNIREYETFYNNISPYIDNELSYEDSIKFRKYLLNSKPARSDLAGAYNLRNNIKQSVENFKNKLNFNYSKKILKRLKNDNKEPFETIYKRAAIAVIIMITTLLIISFIGLNYMHKSVAHVKTGYLGGAAEIPINTIELPNEEDFIEFSFDENNEALLAAK